MPRMDVGVNQPFQFLALAALHAVEIGLKVIDTENLLISYRDVSGDFACSAQRQGVQYEFVHGDDAFAFSKHFDHFPEIAGQRARPAKGVDAVHEGGSDQFVEAVDHLDTGTIEEGVRLPTVVFTKRG